MKLQIKTLSQKSLMVDIEPTKTVYELKKELSMYPDVGVKPELQKLIYAGKILFNEQPLSAYNIDAKKFLVVMVLKQPEEFIGAEKETSGAGSSAKSTAAEASATTTTTTTTAAAASAGAAAIARAAAGSASSAKDSSTVKDTAATAQATTPSSTASAAAATATTANVQDTTTTTTTTTAAATPTPPSSQRATTETTPQRQQPAQPSSGVNDEMVANIVSMGYPEVEVRRALAASFNNPERAIEYLIEGIPDSVLMQPENAILYGGDSDADLGMSPFEMFRSDPLFRNLRRAIQQHPELINDAIQRVGEANPAILQLINENQQEFLSSLIEGSDDDDEEEGGAPGAGGRPN